MPLQQHHVDQLKTLYRREYGVELNDREAWAMAIRLVNLVRLLTEHHSTEAREVRTNSSLPLVR